MPNDRGTLQQGEKHPVSESAYVYLCTLTPHELAIWQESFSSCAIEGNRMADILSETLRRFMFNEPVSDRYIMGLAFFILRHKLLEQEDKTNV